MIRRINIALVGIILLSGILNASVADSARTRYSAGIQLGSRMQSDAFLPTIHVTPLVEYAFNKNISFGFSTALGMGFGGDIFPDLLLQCDMRYRPDKTYMCFITGLTFEKPFYDKVEAGHKTYYETHQWHKNLHITTGIGVRWSSSALDVSMIWPLFPLLYKWDYFYTTRSYSRYAYLSIGFRFMIKGR